MNDQYLEYIVLLEKTLASFYSKSKKIENLSSIKEVLEFMETHSELHAETIEDSMKANQKPHLDSQEILSFQNKLTKNSENSIKHDEPTDILDNLAYTEEALGDYYKKIAGTLMELSEYYKKTSELVSTIGDEEYNHRDILLNDKERLL